MKQTAGINGSISQMLRRDHEVHLDFTFGQADSKQVFHQRQALRLGHELGLCCLSLRHFNFFNVIHWMGNAQDMRDL